jgi:hypothetical protein
MIEQPQLRHLWICKKMEAVTESVIAKLLACVQKRGKLDLMIASTMKINLISRHCGLHISQAL